MTLGNNRARRLERAEAAIGRLPPDVDPSPEELAMYADLAGLVEMPVAEYFRRFSGQPSDWPELSEAVADRILSFLAAGLDGSLLGTWERGSVPNPYGR